MSRSLWSLVAIVGCSLAASGCAMCEHCLDYDYPAFGGCCPWTADDHCRAGSAFCGMDGGVGYEVPPESIEHADPQPAAQPEATPAPDTENPPTDLTPPSGRRMRPLGNDPLPPTELPDTGAPALPDLNTPPVIEEPLPDLFDR